MVPATILLYFRDSASTTIPHLQKIILNFIPEFEEESFLAAKTAIKVTLIDMSVCLSQLRDMWPLRHVNHFFIQHLSLEVLSAFSEH